MSKKILIIDDDVDFVEAMKKLLHSQGFDSVSAIDGDEGLLKVKEDRPDLILLDVMMKKATEGFEVAKELNKSPDTKKIPIILITGIRRELNLPFGFEKDDEWLPVKAVLEKPVQPANLFRAIDEIFKGDNG